MTKYCVVKQLPGLRRRKRKTRKNPSTGIRIVHNRLLGGWYVVRGPHQTPLNGRFDSKAEAQAWLDDSSSRGRKVSYVRATYQNPTILKAHAHGVGKQSPGDKLRDERYYDERFYRAAEKRKKKKQKRIAVQMKLGLHWQTMHYFPDTEKGRVDARKYGEGFKRYRFIRAILI